jgi:hypothetical protein
MLRYLTYAEGYGQFPLARENYQALDERVRNVSCGDCTECGLKCANGVAVRERVSRAQELLA